MDNEEDEDEGKPMRSQENLVNDSNDEEDDQVPLNDDGDIDESEMHNVSPRQTPAAQIAVLNVKFKLDRY